jgi:adenosylcobinamide-GDP ribazoletransferase
LKKEYRILQSAFMFLTRLPVSKHLDHNEVYLQKATKYFPLVGWVVGAICGLVFLVANKFLTEDIAILASMIAGILTTGAFHEDGFADACDGFGGGWTKEKILLIMKDSRLGTYGVIGLIGILGSKFLLLQSLPKYAPAEFSEAANIFMAYKNFLLLLIAAHALSRFMAVTVIQQYEYVRDADGKSKPLAHHKLNIGELLTALLFTTIPFLFLSWHFALCIIPVIAGRFYLAAYYKKWIGGYTGDCLGALQQVTEIIFYLSALIIWKYIL